MNRESLPSMKTKAFNIYILLVLTYDSETLCLTKDLERWLRSKQRGVEGNMLVYHEETGSMHHILGAHEG